jgi:hypothetical protein
MVGANSFLIIRFRPLDASLVVHAADRATRLRHYSPRSAADMREAAMRIGLAVVRGRSMLPTLCEGDRLLVVYGGTPAAGRIAVVRLPDGVVAVKRLDLLADDGWWVSRDNPRQGVDSWSAGRAVDEVMGIAVLRLWPRPALLRRSR